MYVGRKGVDRPRPRTDQDASIILVYSRILFALLSPGICLVSLLRPTEIQLWVGRGEDGVLADDVGGWGILILIRATNLAFENSVCLSTGVNRHIQCSWSTYIKEVLVKIQEANML
jgi:hypothetical protein